MVATGLGNVLASQLLHRAHAEPGWHLYAPARALFEADRTSGSRRPPRTAPTLGKQQAQPPRRVLLQPQVSSRRR